MNELQHNERRPKVNPPMAMMVSISEQRHIDEIRARSIELAVARGYLRRC